MSTTESITISAFTVRQLLGIREIAEQNHEAKQTDESAAILRTLESTMRLIGIKWEQDKPKAEKVEETEHVEETEQPTATEYPTDDRMFQLQVEATRYHDGLKSYYGHDKSRNYKTLKNAIRSAKKDMKQNDLKAVVRCEEEVYGPRTCDTRLHCFADDGHEFTHDEWGTYGFWHIDGVRIVDRITKKVLWEERAC